MHGCHAGLDRQRLLGLEFFLHEEGLHRCPNGVLRGVSVDLSQFVQGLEVLNDRHRLCLVGPESFPDALNVVVRPAAVLPTLEKPSLHNVLSAVKKEAKFVVTDITHQRCPAIKIVLVPRKAVNEKPPPFPAERLHFLLQELYGNFNRDNFALLDEIVDQLSKFTSLVCTLLAQAVASANVFEAEVLFEKPALSTLPRPRAPQNKDNNRLCHFQFLCLAPNPCDGERSPPQRKKQRTGLKLDGSRV
mmetsp:Transcript_3449/g.7144  ORF Transcript_3449/g.7144 Transcript_3449/m.7144 type:complete len:246 (-) Transcript_3449:259-996(-)